MNDEDRQEMFGIMKEVFLTKTRDEWWEWAKQRQVMLAPVKYIEEAVEDPQLKSREMIIEKDHPTLGKIRQLGNPLKLSDTPSAFRMYCPNPGQNTDEILAELKLTQQQVTDLKKQGIVE